MKKKKDIIIVCVIIGLALIFLLINRVFFQNKGETYCEIYVDGELVETTELNKNREFTVDEVPAITFEVKDQSIAFIHSDCPDKVCIQSGYLKHTGQSASCLPNKTTIRICSRSTNEGEPDVVVYAGQPDLAAGGNYEE